MPNEKPMQSQARMNRNDSKIWANTEIASMTIEDVPVIHLHSSNIIFELRPHLEYKNLKMNFALALQLFHHRR